MVFATYCVTHCIMRLTASAGRVSRGFLLLTFPCSEGFYWLHSTRILRPIELTTIFFIREDGYWPLASVRNEKRHFYQVTSFTCLPTNSMFMLGCGTVF